MRPHRRCPRRRVGLGRRCHGRKPTRLAGRASSHGPEQIRQILDAGPIGHALVPRKAMDRQFTAGKLICDLSRRERPGLVAANDHVPRSCGRLESAGDWSARICLGCGRGSWGRHRRGNDDSRIGAALQQLALKIFASCRLDQHDRSAIRTRNLSLACRPNAIGRQTVGLGASWTNKAHGQTPGGRPRPRSGCDAPRRRAVHGRR